MTCESIAQIIFGILLLIFIEIIRYHFIYKQRCDKCHATYDSLYYSHCCECKKVYISYWGEGDGFCCFYDHCCDCNSEYDTDTKHVCNTKQKIKCE